MSNMQINFMAKLFYILQRNIKNTQHKWVISSRWYNTTYSSAWQRVWGFGTFEMNPYFNESAPIICVIFNKEIQLPWHDTYKIIAKYVICHWRCTIWKHQQYISQVTLHKTFCLLEHRSFVAFGQN